MRERRALFVTSSPLLADVLSRAVALRLEAADIALSTEIIDDEGAAIRETAPDLIVQFEDGPRLLSLEYDSAPVLIIANDLSRVYGQAPSPDGETPANAIARALIAARE